MIKDTSTSFRDSGLRINAGGTFDKIKFTFNYKGKEEEEVAVCLPIPLTKRKIRLFCRSYIP